MRWCPGLDTSVFLTYWYWYLFSILQIEYWYLYFSILKSYWIVNTSIFILYWSGHWLKVRWRFCKISWTSHNIWTLKKIAFWILANYPIKILKKLSKQIVSIMYFFFTEKIRIKQTFILHTYECNAYFKYLIWSFHQRIKTSICQKNLVLKREEGLLDIFYKCLSKL